MRAIAWRGRTAWQVEVRKHLPLAAMDILKTMDEAFKLGSPLSVRELPTECTGNGIESIFSRFNILELKCNYPELIL